MLVYGSHAPVTGIHGGQYLHVDSGRAEYEVAPGGHVTGIADDDGHDGYASLHREVECTFLEGRHFRRYRAGALRRQHHGAPLVAHGVNQRRHGFYGAARIGPVDEHHAADLQHLAENGGLLLNLLLADPGDILAQQLGDYNHIRLALVVEDEYRRALGPQVFLAGHVQVHANEGAGCVGEQGERKVQGLALGAGQRIDWQAGDE